MLCIGHLLEFQNIITNPYNLYNKHFHVHFKDQSTVVEKWSEFCKRHSLVIKAMILSQVCRFYNFFLLSIWHTPSTTDFRSMCVLDYGIYCNLP